MTTFKRFSENVSFDLWPWPQGWGLRFLQIHLQYKIWNVYIALFLCYQIYKLGFSCCPPGQQGDDNTPSAFYSWEVKMYFSFSYIEIAQEIFLHQQKRGVSLVQANQCGLYGALDVNEPDNTASEGHLGNQRLECPQVTRRQLQIDAQRVNRFQCGSSFKLVN